MLNRRKDLSFQAKPDTVHVARGYSYVQAICRYVPPERVGFLRRFGTKTGIDFAH